MAEVVENADGRDIWRRILEVEVENLFRVVWIDSGDAPKCVRKSANFE